VNGPGAEPPPEDPDHRRWPWSRQKAEDRHQPGRARTRTPSAAGAEQERLIIERLADLRDMEVREVMTPSVDVVALTIPVTAEDVIAAVRESGHSCFPVVADDLDDLVGVLYANDLFRVTPRRSAGDLTERSPLDISRRIRQPHVVPETRQVLDVLSEMRQQHRGFAVVVDEYGGVAGVLTVKDLIEPLVGDLQDEFDADEGPDVVRVDVNRWLIDGRTSIDEVHERLGIELPDGEYVTIGGYLFDGFGHIPVEGERLAIDGWELRVVELDKRRIAKVLAKRVGAGERESDGADAGTAPIDPGRPKDGPPGSLRQASAQVSASEQRGALD
jgi:CBS domain containing-hemolysin-like protein